METFLYVLAAFALADLAVVVFLIGLVGLLHLRRPPPGTADEARPRPQTGPLLASLVFLAGCVGMVYLGVWLLVRG